MSDDCIASLDLFVVPPGWLFLKVTTEEGLAGWGEPAVAGSPERVAMAVAEMADFMAGHPVDRIDDLFQGLHRGGFYQGGPILMNAISGIEQALWDIKGQRLGLPVHDMLGGVVRDRIPAAARVSGSDPRGMAALAERYVEAGFGAVHVLVAGAATCPDEGQHAARVVAEVELVRDAIGAKRWMSVGFSDALGAGQAKRVVAELADFDPLFLADAIEPRGAGAWLDVSGDVGIRLATGSRDQAGADFEALVTGKRVDIIQPDASHTGGIWEMKKLAVLAEQHDVSLAPACHLGPIALAASLQVGFAASNVLVQEVGAGLGEMAAVREGGFFELDGGAFVPNGMPGLGIVVNEDWVREQHEGSQRWQNPVWRDELDAAVGW